MVDAVEPQADRRFGLLVCGWTEGKSEGDRKPADRGKIGSSVRFNVLVTSQIERKIGAALPPQRPSQPKLDLSIPPFSSVPSGPLPPVPLDSEDAP